MYAIILKGNKIKLEAANKKILIVEFYVRWFGHCNEKEVIFILLELNNISVKIAELHFEHRTILDNFIIIIKLLVVQRKFLPHLHCSIQLGVLRLASLIEVCFELLHEFDYFIIIPVYLCLKLLKYVLQLYRVFIYRQQCVIEGFDILFEIVIFIYDFFVFTEFYSLLFFQRSKFMKQGVNIIIPDVYFFSDFMNLIEIHVNQKDELFLELGVQIIYLLLF